MDQPSEGKISHRPKKPLCISIIMIVLVLINTSAFSCFAIYKYQMEETSPVGRYLVSQYYMFTNLDPHRNKSCRYNAEEELECDFYIPRGAFMRPQGDDDDAGYYEEAESAQAKSKRKTTKSSVVKHKKKGLGTNRTTTTDSSRNTDNTTETSNEFPNSTFAQPTTEESLTKPSNTTEFDIYHILFPQFPAQRRKFKSNSVQQKKKPPVT